jgi:hypothetical protein
MTSTIRKRFPRRRFPKALMAVVTPTTVATTTAATLAMSTLSGCIHCVAACRRSITELYASVGECFQAMEMMRQRMEDLE